jgi:hypothetical protein
MLVVLAHEEPHPVTVPENVALDKLTVVTAVAHRSVAPFGTSTLSFLLVSNSKSNLGPVEAIESLQNDEKYDISLLVSFEIIEQNITGYDNKFYDKNKTASKCKGSSIITTR